MLGVGTDNEKTNFTASGMENLRPSPQAVEIIDRGKHNEHSAS